jgi:hypothetical protein
MCQVRISLTLITNKNTHFNLHHNQSAVAQTGKAVTMVERQALLTCG